MSFLLGMAALASYSVGAAIVGTFLARTARAELAPLGIAILVGAELSKARGAADGGHEIRVFMSMATTIPDPSPLNVAERR